MIIGYFGNIGCGKSTMLVQYAIRELNRIKRGKSKYQRVCTIGIAVSGCEYIDNPRDLIYFSFYDTLLLIDEATIFADNRDFKNFKYTNFFVLSRHYNCDIVYFTQQFDAVDKKIRNLTSNLYQLKKGVIFPITKAKIIYRKTMLDENTHDIVTGYEFPHRFASFFNFIFINLFGLCRYCWRPKYYKYFDSWELPPDLQLPEKKYNIVE